MRDYKLHLEDILNAIAKIEKCTRHRSYKRFREEELLIDGVVRNSEIIGEASRNLPAAVKNRIPDIEWKKISGLRNILIHEYFGVDVEILWDIVKNKLPELKKTISSYLIQSQCIF